MAITIFQLMQHVADTQQSFIDIIDGLIKDAYQYKSKHGYRHGDVVIEVSIPYTKKWQNANHDFIVEEYKKAGWTNVELSLPYVIFEIGNEDSYGKESDGKMKLFR